jgi:hypothetical protein
MKHLTKTYFMLTWKFISPQNHCLIFLLKKLQACNVHYRAFNLLSCGQQEDFIGEAN